MPEEIANNFKEKFAHAIEDWEFRLSKGLCNMRDDFEENEFTAYKATPQALSMSQRTMDDSGQAKQSAVSSAKTKAFDLNGPSTRNNLPDFSTLTKQGVRVKSVKPLIGEKRTFYNAFCGAGELAVTLIDVNPDITLIKRF